MQHPKEKSELINNKSNLTVNLIAWTNLTSGCQKERKNNQIYKGRRKDDNSQAKEERQKNIFDWIPHNQP